MPNKRVENFRSGWACAEGLASSYSKWVEDHIADGYAGYLMTFMFKTLYAGTQGGQDRPHA